MELREPMQRGFLVAVDRDLAFLDSWQREAQVVGADREHLAVVPLPVIASLQPVRDRSSLTYSTTFSPETRVETMAEAWDRGR